MSAGERFKSWIDGLAASWQTRLLGWIVSIGNPFIGSLIQFLAPWIENFTRGQLQKIIDDPDTSPEMRSFANGLLELDKLFPQVWGWVMTILGVLPQAMGLGMPLGRVLEYSQDKGLRSRRLDPLSVINAWRRDPEAYAKYFDDLKEQGWSDDRIEALKFVTQYMPTPQDLVNWEAKEVFEPEMIARYGLDSEFGGLDLTLFEKIGVTPEQALNYWRAHWEHASWNQVVEMVRRGQMTEDDVRDWFRLVEIPPFWRDKLIAISWEVPTRVDVRRFWDMRTIDEARLREIYTAQGYHGKDLEDYVLWTKIYVDFPDLMTRYKNGWLTLDDVRSELVKLGMTAERAEELIQTKVKAVASEKMVKDKDLTAAEIVRGVKKEVITWSQGIELLMDLGYDEWEAEFKLRIDVEVLTGSPESFAEFKEITSLFRQVVTKGGPEMPDEIKKAAEEVVRLTAEVNNLKESIAREEAALIPDDNLPPEATTRLKELQVFKNRAEAELVRVTTDYNILVSEWRQKE